MSYAFLTLVICLLKTTFVSPLEGPRFPPVSRIAVKHTAPAGNKHPHLSLFFQPSVKFPTNREASSLTHLCWWISRDGSRLLVSLRTSCWSQAVRGCFYIVHRWCFTSRSDVNMEVLTSFSGTHAFMQPLYDDRIIFIFWLNTDLNSEIWGDPGLWSLIFLISGLLLGLIHIHI